MGIVIRRFEKEDAQNVSELIAKTLRTSNSKDYSKEFIEEAVRRQTPDKIIQKDKETHFYVACEDEKIIGCGAIGPWWGKIDESGLFTIFVLPEYQGKGIGRKIIGTLENDEYFFRAKCVEIPASITGCGFYRKMGYEYKSGVDQIDEEQMYRLEKRRNIVVRNITEKDIPAVVDIQINGWKTAYKGIIDDNFLNAMDKERERKIQKRKGDLGKSPFVVAEMDGEVVGFCRYYAEVISPDSDEYDSEIMALYVTPDLKGQGIGKTMMNYVKSNLKNQGKNQMILWCLKENYPSRKFYEKMGGTLVGEHKCEFGGKLYEEVGFGYKL